LAVAAALAALAAALGALTGDLTGDSSRPAPTRPDVALVPFDPPSESGVRERKPTQRLFPPGRLGGNV
ncbi:MAG: hypothetical protein M3327_08455, partial [Actinomycetota bacterium]|nr:hypothetical protein [Actinomycetota bacterium]